MTKSRYAILIWVFLLSVFLFIGTVSAQESVTANDFTVTWYDCNHDLTKSDCKVDIQNLVSVARNFNLTGLISDTDYNLNVHETQMVIYEWKSSQTEIPVYKNVSINQTCYTHNNETNTSIPYNCPYNQTIQNGTKFVNLAQWKASKTYMLKNTGSVKANYGLINIPKYGSKVKVDDFGTIETINGTKTFKIEWTTPIIKSDRGYGSSGKMAFVDEISNIEYHPWWNSSWSSRIDNTITDGVRPYQISLNLSNSTGTNNATHVYCNGKCNVNFTDVRFTLDNTTALPYWVESNTTGNVWINLTANGTVNMYYGNPNATTISSGVNTFVFFDDFIGTTIDTSKWSQILDAGSESVSNSIFTVTGATGAWNMWRASNVAKVATPFIVEFYMKSSEIAGTGANGIGVSDFLHNNYFAGDSVFIGQNANDAGTAGKTYINRNETLESYSSRTSTLTSYTIIKIIVKSSGVEYYENDVLKTNLTSNVPDDPMGPQIGAAQANSFISTDWFFIRNYVSPEPVWATWGIETGQEFTRYVSDAITVTDSAISSLWAGVYYTVSGYVYNILSSPLEDARVEYVGGVNYSFTDAAGYYSISVPAGDDREILSRAIGYRNDTEIIDLPGNVQQNFTLNERTFGTVTTPGFGAISGIFIIGLTIIIMKFGKKKRSD